MQINRWYGGEDGAHAVRGKTKIADEKYSNVQILFGGNRGKKQLEQMAADSREEFWHVPKLMAAGDMVLFYIDRPTSAIIAIGRTLSRPRATKLKWYEAKVGKVRLLDAPIKLAELREMFPGWTWLLRPASSYM